MMMVSCRAALSSDWPNHFFEVLQDIYNYPLKKYGFIWDAIFKVKCLWNLPSKEFN